METEKRCNHRTEECKRIIKRTLQEVYGDKKLRMIWKLRGIIFWLIINYQNQPKVGNFNIPITTDLIKKDLKVYLEE